MAIAISDIKYYLSGGAANSDGNASLGGVISTTEQGTGLHELFDLVTGDDSEVGDTEYRCVYVKNISSTDTAYNARLYISANTPGTGTSAEVGLGSSAIGGTEQTVADEDTAPSGVTFSAADGLANALTVGDLAPGQTKAFWIKRVVAPAAAAIDNDSVQWVTRVDSGE